MNPNIKCTCPFGNPSIAVARGCPIHDHYEGKPDSSHPEQGEQGDLYRMGEWQRCPLCEGHGQILADGFTSLVYQPCPTCQGNRIIQKPIIEGKLSSPPPEGQDEIKRLRAACDQFKELRKLFIKGSPLTNMMDKIIIENNL